LAVVTEVNEDDDDDLIEDEIDSSEDELQRRFDKMTFVVSTRKLEQLHHWVKVSEVFRTDESARIQVSASTKAPNIAMRLRSRFQLIKLPILLLLMIALSSQVWGQNASLPTRTECKQWDDAYLGFFWAFFWGTLLMIAVLNVILPPLAGRFY